MIMKCAKVGVVSVLGLGLLGGLAFGPDALSYAKTGVYQVQKGVRDAVPMAMELERAKMLLEEVIPEMNSNITLISTEEVEIAALEAELETASKSRLGEQKKVLALRDKLDVHQVAYRIGGRNYGREEVTQELSRRFDRLKESEMIFKGKQRLLETRKKSLNSAIAMLKSAKHKKLQLEDRIAALEGQHRLIVAASRASGVQVDGSKFAEIDKVLKNINKQLKVSERVLAHQSKYIEHIEIDVVDEKDLLEEIDAFAGRTKKKTTDEMIFNDSDEIVMRDFMKITD